MGFTLSTPAFLRRFRTFLGLQAALTGPRLWLFAANESGGTMKKWLVVVCMLLPAVAADAADTIIVQKGRVFRPGEVTINRGESLTFTNEDSFIHQIYVDGQFDTEEKGPGENINQTFLRSGTFQVRCHIHPTMKMTVHVK